MKTSTLKVSPKTLFTVTKGLYGMGTVLLTITLILSTGVIPASASLGEQSNPAQTLFCSLGSFDRVIKVENQSSPWKFTLSGGGYISAVGIKASTECAKIFTSDGETACYRVSGIGTSSVTVLDRTDAPSSCRDISHLELGIIDPVPTPTTQEPTLTPTPGDATLTPTPEDPTLTPTPEDPTLTPTPEDPTLTPTPEDPTLTPTPEDPTLTPTPEDPTLTPTPKDPTATPQDPTATPKDPTATPQDPTATPQDPTATPQDPTATPQDPTETPVDPTATPRTRNTPTPVPTLPPPPEGGAELLIPVTGVEVPFSTADAATDKNLLTSASANLSMLFFGFGLIFHGAAVWQNKREDQ